MLLEGLRHNASTVISCNRLYIYINICIYIYIHILTLLISLVTRA